MKAEVNSFDVRALVRELQLLVDGRLDKAYQPTREEVLLRFRITHEAKRAALGEARAFREEEPDETGDDPDTGEGGESPEGGGGGLKRDLLIRVGKHFFLTANPPESPQTPPTFAMTLRKHLGGGRVLAVRQHGFDRIVEMDIGKKDALFTLVFEFFGDGNVILVQNGRILVPLIHQSWATRDVRPGREFHHPPATADPFRLQYEEFRTRVLASTSDAVRTLATEFNLPGLYAEEACLRANVPKNAAVSGLAEGEVRALFNGFRSILSPFEEGRLEPVLLLKDGEKADAAPIRLLAHERFEAVPQPTFNAAMDALLGRGRQAEKKPQEDPRVVKWRDEKARIERQLAQQEGALKKFKLEEAESKAKGDLLYAHFDLVNRVRDILMKASRDLGWPEVQARLKAGKQAGNPEASAVDTLNPNEGWAILALPDMDGKLQKVKFDLRKNMQDNAQSFYDKAKKMREKQDGALVALGHTREKLAEMEKRGVELVEDLQAAAARAPPTKRFWFEGYRWFITTEGNLVLGGRDASSNDKLVKKHLTDGDRYVHAEFNGAPSCVVKPNAAGEISEAALAEAGQFATAMSRAWSSGLASADAYWVTPLQVSKTPQPGEFLAKGAFIIRGKRNFMHSPLRAAVGEVQHEGARKVMGGPVSALASRSTKYLVLEPGKVDRNKVANALSKALTVPLEEVQAVMPPGDVRIVENHGIPLEGL